MKLRPLYTPKNTKPVHSLRFDWTGWIADTNVFPDNTSKVIQSCTSAWKTDGFHMNICNHTPTHIQILCTVTPSISPVLFSQRIKGRLSHAFRSLDKRVPFSGKSAVRTIGDNTRITVERYIQKQVKKSDYVDQRFKDLLQKYTITNEDVLLSEPCASTHGRYWYNVHVVLVVNKRKYTVTLEKSFTRIRDMCLKTAHKKGYELSTLSIMPDHIHMAVKGNINHSPEDIALSFMNNISYAMGYFLFLDYEYYVGTFSEYSVKDIKSSPAPPG